MGKKVKNKEIAERLGVSSTLVSLVLNNKADQHGIRKDTQERVLALARQMGYFDLVLEKTETSSIEEKPGIIGMVIPAANDPFIYGIVPYLQKAFESIGFLFSVTTKDPDETRAARIVAAYKKFFTGLILVGDAADDYVIRSLRAASFPFVLLEKSVSQMRLNTVCSDLSDGAQRVVNHIAKIGYKNVLIITDKYSPGSESYMIEILRNAFRNREGMNMPVIIELENTIADNEIEFSQIEKYLRPPYSGEIMIILSSEMVYRVITTFRRKKVRIPQDIALICMEEGIGFDLICPSVTCLRKPMAGMALKVANMIWTEVKNAGKSKYKRQVNMSPELVVRQSCGTIG
ncbi:MAG: substrate-binding domain-containing protein [Bacteroidales bacterium]|jgi:LacI family transcriptional regulator|nr:substrate-binding domain-containing protein [Bacteroidales bacterium]HPM87070.1 LacI family DNA-binding transcriptional regulator [Bacteroidales bacterium]HQG78009.1 LacI family DNA-binding transcriptional regulator [Bacteroidales bacterium]